MRQSQLFTKTRREAPADETAKNAQLLIRAGFINKEMAGVYDYLPLGLRVLGNIKRVVREEMNKVGGQELLLTALQEKALWEKTDRWDDEKVDNWFKTELKSGGEIGLAITHEEPLTRIMTQYVSSYKDLPILAYQFQNKFRNELRAKSGIMRGREFLMKDLYSFSKTEAEHQQLYERVREAYKKIFARVGLGNITFVTFASGGIFSRFSEEFQTLSEVGEDTIYLDEEKGIAINKEVYTDEVVNDLNLNKDSLVEKKSIEVGNIFNLNTKFSESLHLTYTTEEGEKIPVIMGSYGIGIGRLMGTIVEVLSDDKGMRWPKEVAPFHVHIVELNSENADVNKKAQELYEQLSKKYDVLWDDRIARAGEKFADADLIGIPVQIIVSEKGIGAGTLELKQRATGEVTHIEIGAVEGQIDALLK